MGVLKKALSMGADDLIVVQDDAFRDIDAYATAQVLTAAIKKIDKYDLVICGRQASDWDNSLVPIGIAEFLGFPCVTIAQAIDIADNRAIVKRVLDDGYEVVEAKLPLVITVSNELGEPRYPTLRGIMAAGRKEPTIWSASDLFIDGSSLTSKLRVANLSISTNDRSCEFIQGETDEDSGRLLALKLHESGLI
jgi:electron transfer flavoprotein beta subunit